MVILARQDACLLRHRDQRVTWPNSGGATADERRQHLGSESVACDDAAPRDSIFRESVVFVLAQDSALFVCQAALAGAQSGSGQWN
jgi:hypothetical protein